MIGRKTAKLLADAFEIRFPVNNTYHWVGASDHKSLMEWLYVHDYPEQIIMHVTTPNNPAGISPYILTLQGKDGSEAILLKLATDILVETYTAYLQKEKTGALDILPGQEQYPISVFMPLINRLELDGYKFDKTRLLKLEANILDEQEETGILHQLYSDIKLGNKSDAFEFLRLSEEHYIKSLWSDSIGNARKFLEITLTESARLWMSEGGNTISEALLAKPVEVRDYLLREGVLDVREKATLHEFYGLLSNVGSHPHFAAKDQARLLRNLALTYTQFILLRLKGKLQERASTPTP